MPNIFTAQKANRVATPPVKNSPKYVGGRTRSKFCRLQGAAAVTAAADVVFLETFQLTDTILGIEVVKSVANATQTMGVGPYVPKVLTTDTAVLSPISGGTASATRYSSAIATAGIILVSAPTQLFGNSGVPTIPKTFWEELGYATLEAALIDIPGGAVDLGVTIGTAGLTSQDVSWRVTYTAGD